MMNRGSSFRKIALLAMLLAASALVFTLACRKTEEPPPELPPPQERPPDHRVKAHALFEGAPPVPEEGEEQGADPFSDVTFTDESQREEAEPED